MIETFSAMLRIATTVSFTVPAALLGLGRALDAICSVWRLFSAFWVIEADICSRLEVVSSTEAACSLVPCERVCEVAETCAAASSAPWRPCGSRSSCG